MIQLITVINERLFEFDNIGISRISAFLHGRGIDVKTTYIYQENGIEEMNKIDLSCDIFGFSAYNTNIDFIFTLARMIKEQNCKKIVFLGSKFASDAADLILEESQDVDFIVLGHGEYPLVDFCALYRSGKKLDEIYDRLPNIKARNHLTGKEECVSDINTLVWPERNYIHTHGYLTANICASHGCAGKCSFCSVTEKKHKWSGRDANDIFREVKSIYEKYGIRFFNIVDGSFEDFGIIGKERLKKFCKNLMEYPVKLCFNCYMRAESFNDTQEDKELIQMMAKAGLTNVSFGIDAGNEKDLLLYNKRATLLDNNNALNLFAQNGINPLYGFIFLNPYTDDERIVKNYEFLKNHNCDDLGNYTNILQVFFNTPIYLKLKKDGLLKENYSYKTIYGYKFLNKQANSLFDFIIEVIRKSPIARYSYEYFNFKHLYNNMYYLNMIPEKIEVQKKVLTECLSQCLQEYFYELYIKHNYSKVEFEKFECRVSDFYESARKTHMRLAKDAFKLSNFTSSNSVT